MKRRSDGAGRKGDLGLGAKVFRALLDQAGDAIEVTDPDTLRFLYFNEATLRMHGYSREELASISVHDLDPFIGKAEMQDINDKLQKNRSAIFESVHRRKDGSTFPVEVRLSLVRIDGRDWRLAMVRDITERKQAETGLQFFRTLLDRASDAIEVLDPETLRYLDVNETACRTLGYSRDELLEMRVYDVDPGMDSVPMDQVNAVLAQGRSVTHESFHRRKDGSTFPVEVIISQVELDRTYNIAVARDITTRKQTERLLQDRERLLQEAQQFGHLGHWSWDLVGKRSTISDEIYRIFGYVPRSASLSIHGFLRAVHPDDRKMVRGLMQHAVKTHESTETDFRITTKDGGKVRWIHEKSTTSVDADGKPTRVFGICQDITGQKQQAEILRRSLEQSVLTIADTVEARDPYTAGHQRRVGELASAIAREMRLPEDQVQGIYLASLIHDLGKIHIPAEILSKPGRLSEVEHMMIQTHPQAGYDIVKRVDFPWPIAEIILQHHERLDGSGYPQGLKGGKILIEARIIAVADVVESMTSHRPYREGLGMKTALAEIKKQRGKLYDRQAVDACLALFREGYRFPDRSE